MGVSFHVFFFFFLIELPFFPTPFFIISSPPFSLLFSSSSFFHPFSLSETGHSLSLSTCRVVANLLIALLRPLLPSAFFFFFFFF